MSKKSRQHRAKSATATAQPAAKAQVPVQGSDAQINEQLQDPAPQELTDGQGIEQLGDSIDEVSARAQHELGEGRTDDQARNGQLHDEPIQGERAQDERAQDEQAQDEQARSDRAEDGLVQDAQSQDDLAQEAQAQDAQSRELAPEPGKRNNKRAKHAAEQGQMPTEQPPVPIESTAHRGDQLQADIRGVLIQLAGARLLLPNANIAEVLSYAPPEPVDTAPEWLLGKMRWRGWQLPLVAFAELAGLGKEPAGLGSKVVVLKALGGNPKAPYFAILTQGFPRLVTVSKESLPDADSAQLPPGVLACVIMNEDTAFVPDLVAVEGMINDALAQAA